MQASAYLSRSNRKRDQYLDLSFPYISCQCQSQSPLHTFIFGLNTIGGTMDLEGDEMASTTPANSMELQVDEVAKAFVDHYYNIFDNSRPNLPALYDSSSVMSFEGQKIEGPNNISLKLANLSFNECKHYISTIDCQSTGVAGGIIVFVSGRLQLPGEEHYLRFSQMFHLVPTPEGSFYIHNDIFRLNYG